MDDFEIYAEVFLWALVAVTMFLGIGCAVGSFIRYGGHDDD